MNSSPLLLERLVSVPGLVGGEGYASLAGLGADERFDCGVAEEDVMGDECVE
jgi:hypothetical protein